MGVEPVVSRLCVIEPYGKVNIRVLRKAVNVRARWRGDVLHISVPPISESRLREILAGMEARIMAHKPMNTGPLYHNGFVFVTDGWRFEIVESDALPPGIADAITPNYEGEPFHFRIRYGAGSDMSSQTMQQAIGRVVKSLARYVAENLLIDQAYVEAGKIGLRIPFGHITVGRGIKRLGSCKGDGRISLSYILMFVDVESRRSTIMHEFAHLWHFNHSPEFYALWDRLLGYPHRRATLADMNLPLPGM